MAVSCIQGGAFLDLAVHEDEALRLWRDLGLVEHEKVGNEEVDTERSGNRWVWRSGRHVCRLFYRAVEGWLIAPSVHPFST